MSSTDATSTSYRLETASPDDQSSHLWVLAILCVCFSSTALIARFMIRRTGSGFDFSWDDYTVLSGWV